MLNTGRMAVLQSLLTLFTGLTDGATVNFTAGPLETALAPPLHSGWASRVQKCHRVVMHRRYLGVGVGGIGWLRRCGVGV